MNFKYFSKNGELRPVEEAVVPLENIEYQYGFGVYETIRVVRGVPYFLADHVERLMESARIIGIEHPFGTANVEKAVRKLVAATAVESYNLKVLLLGGAEKEGAQLFIVCLAPHFPDKKIYREGVAAITYEYERPFPHAKSLNMLESYLAFKQAKEHGCYDALLVDRDGRVLEGTRTNFFVIQGRTIYSPPEEKILLGVTRKALLSVAARSGFDVVQKDIPRSEVRKYDGAFITSTSSKLVPLASIDGTKLAPAPPALRELMQAFDAFLDSCGGTL